MTMQAEQMPADVTSLFSEAVEDASNAAAIENKRLLAYVTNNAHGYTPELAVLFSSDEWHMAAEKFILVKLVEGTVDFAHFQRLYKVKEIPSLVVIQNGTVLSTMCQFNADNFENLISADAPVKTHSSIAKGSGKRCTLSFRLLDGTTVQKQFEGTNTLDDVRIWLDTQSGIDIIPASTSMPSFARPDGLHPTRYAFQSPSIPRTTYKDEHEFMTLAELNLCPRSVLVLKPIFDESVNEAYEHNRSVIRTFNTSVRQFCNAMYSFFDYGVDEENEVSDGFKDDHRSPQMVSIDGQAKQPQAINIEKDFKEPEVEEDVESKTRASSPDPVEETRSHPLKSVSAQPSMTRVQTLHDQVGEKEEENV